MLSTCFFSISPLYKCVTLLVFCAKLQGFCCPPLQQLISHHIYFKGCLLCRMLLAFLCPNEPHLSEFIHLGITDIRISAARGGEKQGVYTEKPELGYIQHTSHLDILNQGGWTWGVVVIKHFWTAIVHFKCKNSIITCTSYFISTGG